MRKADMAEKVLKLLEKQYFYEWYTGPFEAYISGDGYSREEMLEWLNDRFNPSF